MKLFECLIEKLHFFTYIVKVTQGFLLYGVESCKIDLENLIVVLWCATFSYFSFDATNVKNRLARFVNDSPTPNSNPKYIEVDSIPKLCLFAVKEIQMNEEIVYYYNAANLWWTKKVEKISFLDPSYSLKGSFKSMCSSLHSSVMKFFWDMFMFLFIEFYTFVTFSA